VGGREVPFASKDELLKQMPFLKKKFLYAGDFAQSSLEKIFSKEKLVAAEKFEANYFSNAVLINQGGLNFTTIALPWEAQLNTYRDAVIVGMGSNGLPDILLTGNYYENNIQIGRNDAGFGTILTHAGNNSLKCENINGAIIKGQVRRVKGLTIRKKPSFILAKNNDSIRVITFTQPGNKF
jgi:hypothetical protein